MKKHISIIRVTILSLGILLVGGMLFVKQDQLNHARDIIDTLQAQLEACDLQIEE